LRSSAPFFVISNVTTMPGRRPSWPLIFIGRVVCPFEERCFSQVKNRSLHL
jgi:hypothetical protein